MDLLGDAVAQEQLLQTLDTSLPVVIAPYIWTDEVADLVTFLSQRGYLIAGEWPQPATVRALLDKVYVDEAVFSSEELRRYRPPSAAAVTESNLLEVIDELRHRGAKRVVVKSARAAGGIGTFVLSSSRIAASEAMFRAQGDNPTCRAAPFLVEEYVDWDISPTVDLEINEIGHVIIRDVALQRLYDRRYYMGFYWSKSLRSAWWYARVCEIAHAVAEAVYKIGYFGPLNVDFVVCNGGKKITLIELNPRRSALLDGHAMRELTFKEEPQSMSVVDYVDVSLHHRTLADVLTTCDEVQRRGGEIRVTADGGLTSPARWVSVCASSGSRDDSEEVLARVTTRLRDSTPSEIGSIGRQQVRPLSASRWNPVVASA